jgi:hypothetical protein
LPNCGTRAAAPAVIRWRKSCSQRYAQWLCGVEDWETMTLWGRTQLGWLRTHLAYENGIPSPDTFRRVFGALSAKAFERCFIDWVGAKVLWPMIAP